LDEGRVDLKNYSQRIRCLKTKIYSKIDSSSLKGRVDNAEHHGTKKSVPRVRADDPMSILVVRHLQSVPCNKVFPAGMIPIWVIYYVDK